MQSCNFNVDSSLRNRFLWCIIWVTIRKYFTFASRTNLRLRAAPEAFGAWELLRDLSDRLETEVPPFWSWRSAATSFWSRWATPRSLQTRRTVAWDLECFDPLFDLFECFDAADPDLVLEIVENKVELITFTLILPFLIEQTHFDRENSNQIWMRLQNLNGFVIDLMHWSWNQNDLLIHLRNLWSK